jgi:hypothetical protein
MADDELMEQPELQGGQHLLLQQLRCNVICIWAASMAYSQTIAGLTVRSTLEQVCKIAVNTRSVYLCQPAAIRIRRK